MFKDTVTFSALRARLKDFLEMVTDKGDAIQVIHKGNPLRVVITQDYFLELTQKVSMYEMELGIREPVRSNHKRTREADLDRVQGRRRKIEKMDKDSEELTND